MLVGDWKRDRSKKIEAVGAASLQFDLVVFSRVVARPTDAGQRIAETERDQVLFDFLGSFATETADFPLFV